MKKDVLNKSLFFSMMWDFTHQYLPTQHTGSEKTVEAYTDALTIFRRYVTDEKKISIAKFGFDECTYDFVLDYRDFLIGQNYAAATVNQRIAALKAYMRYAALRDVTLQQIYLNMRSAVGVDQPRKIPPIIEEDEALTDLFDAPGPSRLGIRDRTILVVLFDTAIRCDELVSLKKGDVVLRPDSPYLKILGKGTVERKAPLHENTVEVIKQYMGLFHKDTSPDTPFIYTVIKGQVGHMSERNVQRLVKKYADLVREKHPELPHLHPHIFRRTRATKSYRDGTPIDVIAELLGHAHVDTTRRSYAFSSPDMIRKKTSDVKTVADDKEASKKLWEGKEEELAAMCGLR